LAAKRLFRAKAYQSRGCEQDAESPHAPATSYPKSGRPSPGFGRRTHRAGQAEGIWNAAGGCKLPRTGEKYKTPRTGIRLARASEHGRIIAAVATAALAPIGCIRKGHSRVWYSDQRYWLIGVEFQPSGWSKGSYLNVRVAWLWKDSYGYDLGDRPMDFVPFENAEQFTPRIVEMAQIAAREVHKQREHFQSFDKIYRYLLDNSHHDSWPKYNAAIAAALAGDFAISRQLFDHLAAWTTYGYEWQEKLKADSRALADLLSSPAQFRAAVLEKIQRRRKLMRLQPDTRCLDALDSTRVQPN
jgi:hypothetical protein